MSFDTPSNEVRFVVDRMLGKLATYLIMMGYDTLYVSEGERRSISVIAWEQERIILSRDTRLNRQRNLPAYLLVQDDHPREQLKQVVTHFGLMLEPSRYLTRCLRCNEKLVKALPEEVKKSVPPYILTSHRDFSVCPACKRVYWKGSHRKRMEEMMKGIVDL